MADSNKTILTNDDGDDIGGVHISSAVVASIVKHSALEVAGVYSVGGSGLDGLLEHLGGRRAEKGVQIVENADKAYEIKVNLEMAFGTRVFDAAKLVQRNIIDKVKQMTGKQVASVEVFVDGVVRSEPGPELNPDA
ncbi:MAG: Asp23/Gls24 family envelope stress response protein [Opitutales bacterium]